MKETDIQATICEYLQLKMNQNKLLFWRANTTSVYDPTRKVFRSMPKYALKGVADIIVIKDGFAIFLEIKKKGTYQSKEQKEFERLAKLNGSEYYVIRDLDEVIEIGL